MKRLLCLLLVLSLSLCACGNNDDIETTEQEQEPVVQVEMPKGALENPYGVGETIVIDEMYPVSEHPASEIPFRMELTITDVYSPEESESSRYKKQYPVARFTVSVTGDYEGQLELDKFFYRPLLTAEMEKEWPLFFTSDGTVREVKTLEVGEEYDLVLTVYQEDEDAVMKDYPYLMISYYYPDSSTINDIYIDLTSSRSSQTEEEAPDLSAEEQAQYYKAAAEAEAKGYYAVAKNLYEDIPGYQDANVRLQSVLGILAPYNGTYYGESHQHEGVSVWVYVEDGAVWTTYDVDNTPVLEYELFQYETQSDGTPIMAFSTGLTRFFLDNQNASYAHGFTMTQEGDAWTVTAAEGGSDRSWNSTLEKVSDTVNVELD